MSDRFGNIPIQPPESSSPDKKAIRKPARLEPVPVTSNKPGFSKRKLIWFGLATMVLLFALYSALGFWGVPYYFSKIFPEQFHEKTGMELVSSTVTLNPFTFRFETGPLQINSETGVSIVSLQSLTADIDPFALLRLNMVCNSASLNEMHLNIARELDGSYNFQQIFGHKKNSSPAELFDLTNLPFFFSLNNISITNSSIKFNDALAGKTHTIEKIQLSLPTLSNLPFQTDLYLRPHFSAIVNGSPIEMNGEAQMGEAGEEDQGTKLSLDIHDLDLTIYSDYLPFNLPMDVKKGIANGKIDLLFEPQRKDIDKLSIDFQLQITKAELHKHNEAIVALLPIAQMKGQFKPVSGTLHITELVIKEPAISSFGKSFLANINEPANPPRQITVSTQTAPHNLIIDLLLIDDGRIRLFQEKKDKQPTSSWKAIQLSVKNYSSAPNTPSATKKGAFSLSGEKADSLSNFSWQGTFSQADSFTGKLNVFKMDSNFLFKTIDFDPPFTTKGLADLKGELTLSSKKDMPLNLSYKLENAQVSIDNFTLLEKGENILSAPSVKIAPLSLTDGSLDFGNIYFQKATAQFTYGHYPKLFSTFKATQYHLQGIDFEGKIKLNSKEKSSNQITFTDVILKANELGNSSIGRSNLSVTAKTDTGGIFKAQGNVVLAPFAIAIKTGFSELPLVNILPFFTNSTSFDEIEGHLSGKGLFKLPNKSFLGEVQLTRVTGKGAKTAPFSWRKATLQDFNYTAKPFHLGMSSAKIDQAQFLWEITKTNSEPMQYLTAFCQNYFPEIEQRSSANSKSTISPVDIREIAFANGKINISDRRLSPPWKAEVIGFTGQIKNLHSAAGAGKSSFSFTGQLDNTPFAINGSTNPFAKQKNGSFHFSLENYPLASLQKQLSEKTELDTSESKLKISLNGEWRGQQYINSGSVELSHLQTVSTTSDLALPLALLTDPDDTLQLSFDFSRTEPVAKTTLMDGILTSFQTQLIKGAVSPLLLAKGNFADLIDNEYIEFRPGEFVLSDAGRENLTRYVALLTSHPRLGFVLSGGVDKKTDSLAMQKSLTAIEQQRVEKENEKLFKKWQEQKNLYEEKIAKHQQDTGPNGTIVELDIPSEVLTGFKPVLPVPIKVDDAMLRELAQKRIKIVQQYFTKQLDLGPDRIAIIVPESLPVEAENPANGVSVTLKAIER